MEFKYLKKYIGWFCKTELNERKTQEKAEREEKVLALNAGEKKWKCKSSDLLKGKCKKCGIYGHIDS